MHILDYRCKNYHTIKQYGHLHWTYNLHVTDTKDIEVLVDVHRRLTPLCHLFEHDEMVSVSVSNKDQSLSSNDFIISTTLCEFEWLANFIMIGLRLT